MGQVGILSGILTAWEQRPGYDQRFARRMSRQVCCAEPFLNTGAIATPGVNDTVQFRAFRAEPLGPAEPDSLPRSGPFAKDRRETTLVPGSDYSRRFLRPSKA